jgi:hypothetical protein
MRLPEEERRLHEAGHLGLEVEVVDAVRENEEPCGCDCGSEFLSRSLSETLNLCWIH